MAAKSRTTKRRTKRAKHSEPPWADLSDAELLEWRICDLKVNIEGSILEPRVNELYSELEQHNIPFKPRCYLSTEWLSPDRVPLVGIPFCFAHPRLMALEKTMMLEVEGSTEKECMQLLRHEAGHAINYAYEFFTRTRWRELFGPMSTDYDPHNYYQTPYSRQYVMHLKDNYAQAHPDEDFAETFATWLTPGLNWRKRYQGWGALRKLEYVDHLMRSIAGVEPTYNDGDPLWPANKIRSTLANYFKKKRREFAEGYPGYYDPLLRRLFIAEKVDGNEPAHVVLMRHRKWLTENIAKWALVRKYAVDHLVRRLARRCREMNLYLRADEKDALKSIGIVLTSLVLEAREGHREEEPLE